jgi:outer membrane lipoprotein-sorting protein
MIYDGNEVLQADSKTKKFKKMPVFKDDNNSSQASPAKQRYYKGPDGKVQGVKLRKDPAYMGAATEILFNQNIALGFLEDYSKWKIDSEEQLNGFYAIVLSGELESNYKEKHKAETFKIWTHKDTGIMLKMEEYNKQGKVVYSIATQNLELNKPVDYNKIQFTSPANFTEIKE